MSKHPIPGWLSSQFSRIEDEVQELGPCGVFTQMRTVTQTYFEQQAEALQPQKEPVAWGAPKTVRQLIGQLETLDPELETVALYRLPDGLGKLSGKVKQGHISTSYERMEGIWLGAYKGGGRKVLAFWTKLDPREVPDGEPLTQPSALGGEHKAFQEWWDSLASKWHDPSAKTAAWQGFNFGEAKLAPLKAEIEHLRAAGALIVQHVNEYKQERDQLKVRCDELESSRSEIEIVIPKGCGCLNVEMGSYDNQVELKTPEFILELGAVGCLSFRETTCVDACVAPLVLALWERGVVTTGACCGHNQQDGYVGIYRPALSKPAGSESFEYGPTPGCKQCEEAESCGFTDCPECGAQLCEDLNSDGFRVDTTLSKPAGGKPV